MSLKVLVHEIGHNLGLYHDFKTTDSDGFPCGACGLRYAKDKITPCTGIGAFMDYAKNNQGYWKNHVRWSKCSEEDLRKTYNKLIQRDIKFCLLPGTQGYFLPLLIN